MLTLWYRDYGNPDLFRRANRDQASTKIRAAVDANVFFDLYTDAPQGLESQTLLADWLVDGVDLHVTPEMWNEVVRADNPALRQKHRATLTQFTRCEEKTPRAFDLALERITELLPPATSSSDESDRRQLAWAVAGGVEYFLTRDGTLLDHAQQLFKNLKVFVLRPSDFVRQIDEIEREADYAPARLAGTALQIRLVKSGDEENIARTLHTGRGGESRSEFLGRLRAMLSNPKRFEVRAVLADASTPLAIVAHEIGSTNTLRVPLMRVANGDAMLTLARHLLHRISVKAVEVGVDRAEVVDSFPSQQVLTALERDDWALASDGAWRRWGLRFLGTAAELDARLEQLLSNEPASATNIILESRRLLNATHETQKTESVHRIERLLWPAKVTNMGLPTFIVPIKATWAQHLFDESLAKQDLFGARLDLALNRESVYYRSARPEVMTAPGRVLWYVSNDDRLTGTRSIRACSILDEVVVGQGKDIFNRFRRFGVYDWRDIKELLAESPDGRIMAFRFSNTQLLPKPISLSQLRDSFNSLGKGLSLVSPLRIDDETFTKLCQTGDLA